jgi:hypothetical protein
LACIPYYRLELSAAYGRIQLAMSQSHVDAQLGRETFHRIGNEIAAADNMHVDCYQVPGYQLKLKARLV